MHKIIICGLNGAGKSTLGALLAQALGWQFMDIESYYFPPGNTDYNYTAARTKDEVSALLASDMQLHPRLILAAVKGAYGPDVTRHLTGAIFIHAPKDERMARIRSRSHRKFGDRMLPGGDLHQAEEEFFAMAAGRDEAEVEAWLQSLSVPVLRIDGANPPEVSLKSILNDFARRGWI